MTPAYEQSQAFGGVIDITSMKLRSIEHLTADFLTSFTWGITSKQISMFRLSQSCWR